MEVITGGNKYGHVQIYVGEGLWYNAGSTTAIQAVEPYYSDCRAKFTVAYRKTN